ncbi:MAG: Mut7-C RNAse domain-containing protein [Methylomonas lenta]|nr:Mut7-C RNAse domain-containing protein [Methylomonas lenta]
MKTTFEAEFRFYAELNDFLAPPQRHHSLPYRFSGHPGIKDPIEVFGVPHTEVALIIVNGRAVGFDYQLQTGDRTAIYPIFKTLNITPEIKLRSALPTPRFVIDVNLGKLAKRLRMLGFDCLYRNDYHDREIAAIAADNQRIVLTRDRRLLFAKRIDHGYWVRAVKADQQIIEVLSRFNLSGLIAPFARCILCNGKLAPVDKQNILELLEPKTKLYYEIFYRCTECQQIYWKGSHIENMQRHFKELLTG